MSQQNPHGRNEQHKQTNKQTNKGFRLTCFGDTLSGTGSETMSGKVNIRFQQVNKRVIRLV